MTFDMAKWFEGAMKDLGGWHQELIMRAADEYRQGHTARGDELALAAKEVSEAGWFLQAARRAAETERERPVPTG